MSTQDLILGIKPAPLETDANRKTTTPSGAVATPSSNAVADKANAQKAIQDATHTIRPHQGEAVNTVKQPFEEWYKTVPSDRADTSNYNLRRAYELAPMDELEAWRTSPIEDLENGKNHLRTVYEDPKTGNYEFVKSKNHPTINKELEWYNSPEAEDFRKKYKLDDSGDYYRYVRVQPAAQAVAQTGNNDGGKTFTQEEIDKIVEGEKEPEQTATSTGAGTTSTKTTVSPTNVYDATGAAKKQVASASDTNSPKRLTTRAVEDWKTDPDNKSEDRYWEDRQKAAHSDFITALTEYADSIKPETAEEKEKREKRERRSKLFAAIGDGISALSNLYFTTKGAPNMFDPKNTLSGKAQEYYDKLKKERDADNDRWLTIQAKQLGSIDDLIKQRREAEKTRLELAWKAEKAEQDARIAEARASVYAAQGNSYAADVERKNAEAKRAEALAAKAQSEAEWVGKEKQSVVNRNNAAALASKESAANSAASAEEHRARAQNERSGKSSSRRHYGTFMGQDYETEADYNAAVMSAADEYGINKNVQTPGEYDEAEGKYKYKTRQKTIPELAAEVKRKAEKRKTGGQSLAGRTYRRRK